MQTLGGNYLIKNNWDISVIPNLYTKKETEVRLMQYVNTFHII